MRARSCTWVEERLPWRGHADLGPEEAAVLEAHLAACPHCREQAEEWQQIADAVRAGEVHTPTRHPAAVAALMARLDQGSGTGDPGSGIRRKPDTPATPRMRVWAGVAALVVTSVGAGWWALGPDRETTEPTFHTLSDPTPVETHRLRVVFEADITQASLVAVLQAAQARVVDGPSPYGVWTLAADDPHAAVAALRANPMVRFAELQLPETPR